MQLSSLDGFPCNFIRASWVIVLFLRIFYSSSKISLLNFVVGSLNFKIFLKIKRTEKSREWGNLCLNRRLSQGDTNKIVWEFVAKWKEIMFKIHHTRTSKVGSHLHYHWNRKGIFGDISKEAHHFSHTCTENIKSTHACLEIVQTFQSCTESCKCREHYPETDHSQHEGFFLQSVWTLNI